MLALPFLSAAHKVLIESRDLETEYVFGRCIPPSRVIKFEEFRGKAVEYQKWKKGQNHYAYKNGRSQFPFMYSGPISIILLMKTVSKYQSKKTV